MTETKEHPLITFALLTYNQERFVREAVEGAFSQDYSRLEIIISDDCSTDDTFTIIKEMVARYTGRHTVVARQTLTNCGSLLHVADVAKIALGELLVLAAGDDVSKINRVQVLSSAWQRSGAWGLSSRFGRIDENGALLAEDVQASVIDAHGFDRYFHPHIRPVEVVHGCTSAYDARLFKFLRLDASDYVLSEDGALSVLLNLLGKNIAHLDESLVLYRQSAGSLTNNISRGALTYAEVDRDERNIARFAISQANRCKFFLRLNDSLGSAKVREISVPNVRAELSFQERRSKWFELSIFAKISYLMHGMPAFKWAFPRIFGRKYFYTAKWIRSRFY